MNDLEAYFNSNTGRVITKWSHYFDVYERHFSRFRGKDIVILEIGTLHGGSLQMWKDYFGPKAKIYGIDINPNCKEVEDDQIRIMTGSQSDRDFLQKVKTEIPPIDILIDDGGHTMLQQIVTFEELFDHVKPDGVFLCEDMHTSYWVKFGGGLKRSGSFVEYSKNFIDELNAYHSERDSFKATTFTKSVNSLHFYDSILVIEKKPTPMPVIVQTGTREIPVPQTNHIGMKSLRVKAAYKLKLKTNRLLAFFGLPYKNGDFM